ncbi:hypothetical protein BG011_006768 [Mortierella polycephala]|uniref:Uncharacterized protein n=1 Tax=Mortierella polycephala TaxID=41804 RepID=A0A9P6QHK9_9FUNG|nr:hypothetical protein BG011_006768 [Mortierella polycephala]
MALLLDHRDEFVQFTVYRLVKEILVNADFLEMNPSVHPQRQRLVQDLFQKLISTQQPIPGQKRTILELFHALMKLHRQRHRCLGTQNDTTTPAIAMARSDWCGMDHVAAAIVRELATPTFWASTFKHILGAIDTQHAALVLLIDIEKARVSILHNETFNIYCDLLALTRLP